MALAAFDLYPKVRESFQERTAMGAGISLFALICMSVLFLSEFVYFLSTSTVDHLTVDTQAAPQLDILFDLTFPRVPCALLSVDIMDVAGSQSLDIDHDIYKVPLSHDGKPLGAVISHDLSASAPMKEEIVLTSTESDEKTEPKDSIALRRNLSPRHPDYCGSCYGAETFEKQCCNTCKQVFDAYKLKGWTINEPDSIDQCVSESSAGGESIQRHEGCRMHGKLSVNRVAGNFHFAPGHGFQQAHAHIHDLSAFKSGLFDVSHTINHLSFGEAYPGIVNPLDGQQRTIKVGGGIFQYYVKVVPTSYEYLNGTVLDTNQYSVTEHVTSVRAKQGHGLPGAFFFYDLSPIKVHFQEERKSFTHFVTQVCAIVGGVFTVVGIFDKLMHSSIKRLQKTKMGKFS